MDRALTTARAGGAALRLLDRRLVFVTGKGGVGKSTVAAALGIVAARRGLRTIIAEVARRGDVSRALADGGEQAGFGPGSEREIAPNLFAISIDPHAALREYLLDQLPVRPLAELLGSSRTFSQLTAATPGMSELLTIGKIWELAQPRRRVAGGEPFDVVIVDAPPTGYGLAYLAAPRTFAGVAQVGPIARQGRKIHATLADARLTAVVAVATPEEAAITEVLELVPALQEQMGIAIDRVVVNALHPWRFAPRERSQLIATLDEGDLGSTERAAVRIALAEDARVRSQRAALRRLRGIGAEPQLSLPFEFAEDLGREQLERLADELEDEV
jgi:anion-transporting  ArsA/GET3 family ATPase